MVNNCENFRSMEGVIVNNVKDLRLILNALPDEAGINVLGFKPLVSIDNSGALSLIYLPECTFQLDFSGPQKSCEELIFLMLIQNGNVKCYATDYMNCEGDTMTVSLSGVCYGSLHDSFCKEAPESLLSISRRLNLTIEGWGSEDYQEIQEIIYYENGEVITDSTEPLIKESY